MITNWDLTTPNTFANYMYLGSEAEIPGNSLKTPNFLCLYFFIGGGEVGHRGGALPNLRVKTRFPL